ncbi:MAG: hypothetical protein AABY04_01615, partial [Candidatus Micrarchaeota archaeon]
TIFGNWTPPNLVINETIARQSIITAINSTIPNSTVSSDQQIYIVYEDGSQKLGTFDSVAVLGNQTWAFNYITGNETVANMTSLKKVLNILEMKSLSYKQIVSQVSGFISGTQQ